MAAEGEKKLLEKRKSGIIEACGVGSLAKKGLTGGEGKRGSHRRVQSWFRKNFNNAITLKGE